MTDYNNDGRLDLVGIKKSGTGTKTTEVHVYSGASNFSVALEHTGTILHETDETFEFLMVDWNGDGHKDLVGHQEEGDRVQEHRGAHLFGRLQVQDAAAADGDAAPRDRRHVPVPAGGLEPQRQAGLGRRQEERDGDGNHRGARAVGQVEFPAVHPADEHGAARDGCDV